MRVLHVGASRLTRVGRDEIVERSISHLDKADLDYGARVTEVVRELTAKRKKGGAAGRGPSQP